MIFLLKYYDISFIFVIVLVYLLYVKEKLIYREKNILSILIVYVICGKSVFSIHLSNYPVFELRCNNYTNYKDMYEAGLMLDFIIKYYAVPLAEKYIFCQGHDKSHHYYIDFWKRIDYIISTNYFRYNSYGGIYCIYLHSYKTNSYMKEWAGDVNEYMIRTTQLSLLNLNITSPCCATFFVSRKTILKNHLYIYKQLRNELTKYVEMNLNKKRNNLSSNKRAALFMEFYWGKLFGNANSTIPAPPDCAKKLKIWK